MSADSNASGLMKLARFAWLPALAGLGLTVWRMVAQGNVVEGDWPLYPQLSRQFYIKGAAGDWVLTDTGWVWFGLLNVAVAGVILVGVGALILLAGRIRKLETPFAALALLGGLVAVALPLWPIASGLPEAGAKLEKPIGLEGPSADAREGSFKEGVAGRYEVIKGDASVATAKLAAGGEKFDARFPEVEGHVEFDPTHIDAAEGTSATIKIVAASISTGIEGRDDHAKTEDYLNVGKFPDITLNHKKLLSNRIEPSGNLVHFEQEAEVTIMGKALPVSVKGQIKQIDDAARASLKLQGDAPAYQLKAVFEIDLAQTPIPNPAESFDELKVPIGVDLLIQHKGG